MPVIKTPYDPLDENLFAINPSSLKYHHIETFGVSEHRYSLRGLFNTPTPGQLAYGTVSIQTPARMDLTPVGLLDMAYPFQCESFTKGQKYVVEPVRFFRNFFLSENAVWGAEETTSLEELTFLIHTYRNMPTIPDGWDGWYAHIPTK